MLREQAESAGAIPSSAGVQRCVTSRFLPMLDSHRKRTFTWHVTWPQMSTVTIATAQEMREDGGKGGFYVFFH